MRPGLQLIQMYALVSIARREAQNIALKASSIRIIGYLEFQWLDLETETLQDIFESPNWTDKEVEAWLDWDAQETKEVE